jgi:hypothetical protein
MNQADALKKWKKDKPLLLTDTGVSDVLRKLPSDWNKLIDTGAVNATLKELKTMMAGAKISQSKSATASLTEIRKSVKNFLASVSANRERGVEIFQEIHGSAKDILAMCESKKISLSKLKAYPGELSKAQKEMDRLTARSMDASAIPVSVMREFREAMESTVKVAALMAELVEDGMSAKPQRDLKAEFPGLVKRFKAAMNDMPPAWAAVERLP